eukprot:Selendium_serpulae@DN5641_c0_g1_i2.p1
MAPTESAIVLKEILTETQSYFRENNLHIFRLSIPLKGKSTTANKKGIEEKIFKNCSRLISDENPVDPDKADKAFDENGKPQRESEKMVENDEAKTEVKEMVARLADDKTMGFVLVIAEVMKASTGDDPASKPVFRPVAGGILEYLSNGDREIRALWSRRCLPEHVSKDVNRVLCLRLFTEALVYHPPGTPADAADAKAVSIQGNLLLAFPNNASFFITDKTGLQLRMHIEDSKPHSDSQTRCRCLKNNDGKARIFWGIPESRFMAKWRSRDRAPNCDGIPIMPPNTRLNYFGGTDGSVVARNTNETQMKHPRSRRSVPLGSLGRSPQKSAKSEAKEEGAGWDDQNGHVKKKPRLSTR